MTFPEGREAGWHVLIGENGSGKSTIVRAISLALLDYSDIIASNQNWDEWLKKGQPSGIINLAILSAEHAESLDKFVQNRITFERSAWGNAYSEPNVDILEVIFRGRKSFYKSGASPISTTIQYPIPVPTPMPTPPGKITEYWFSAGYGPYRRFSGGDRAKEKAYNNNPHLGAHLSVFGEDIALSEALSYIKDLYTRSLEYRASGLADRQIDAQLYDLLIEFINKAKLLPHDVEISGVTTDGVYFKDGYGENISAIQMSDGYRSILSMTFELIRQFVKTFGIATIAQNIEKNQKITLPGVVLIDEVDAHLHPTWQTTIGQWFTTYFPAIQFIVTTHSPLICRAAEKGTIWQLAAPGSEDGITEITGEAKKRLIYGNVLDAYSTNVFGGNVARSASANDKLNELAALNIRSRFGVISADEEKQLNELRSIFPTEG